MQTLLETHASEWQQVLAEHFSHITNKNLLRELHIAYMCGYSAGMQWMKETCLKAIELDAPKSIQ
jgi:hypothetical protein